MWADRDSCESGTSRREQPVTLRHDADQQEPGDQRERRPDLSGRSGQAGQLVSGCWQNVSPAALAAACTLS
jgi:hypothetical protein